MKKAAQIILLVITVIFGIGLLQNFLYLVLSTALEGFGIALAFGGDYIYTQIINKLYPNGVDDSVETLEKILLALTTVWGFIVLTFNFFVSLVSMSLSAALFGLLLAGTIVGFRAKKKSQTMFPTVVSFILGGLYFLGGATMALTIVAVLPGVFFLLTKDSDYEVKKEEIKDIESKEVKEKPAEEKKTEGPLEAAEAEG